MEYSLNVIADRSVVRESLRGIIWTIFFHRLFGPITPTIDEFLDVPYAKASHLPDLDSLIDEKIDDLITHQFNYNNTHNFPQGKIAQIMVDFHENTTKSKKKSTWFGGKDPPDDDLKLWESWIIHIKCLPVDTDTNSMALSVESFESNLHKIVDLVDGHKNHIPPITSLETSPFPYSITVDKQVDTSYETDESWGKYIKKMLD